MCKEVHSSGICSRLKVETIQMAINNRIENKLWCICSKADYIAMRMHKLVLDATVFHKDNIE